MDFERCEKLIMKSIILNRQYYLDNLRSFTMLMLLPSHTFTIYNTFGKYWYNPGSVYWQFQDLEGII